MSSRQEAAQRISKFICDNDLTDPYGGDIVKVGNHYSISFSQFARLDGVVEIYSSKFIRVIYVTSYRAMPQRGGLVFETEVAALDFLNKAFVQHDFEAALAVPSKGR
jgi:hypothetical protein